MSAERRADRSQRPRPQPTEPTTDQPVAAPSDGPPAGPGPAPGPPPTGWRLWVAGARPRTLPASVVPVLVGSAVVAVGSQWLVTDPASWHVSGPNHVVLTSSSGPLEWMVRGVIIWRVLAAMVVALFIQIGTNFANDYSDGVKGTDEVRVGPIRLVGSGLKPPGAVKKAAYASFGVAALAGLALAAATTWWLIPLGAVCFAAGWLYTGGPKPYGYYGFGELFVFVFFGLVATVGSAYVQVVNPAVGPRSLPWVVWPCAVAVGCLATALLVTNNLRDIPTDTVAGKKTLAVRMGDQATRIFYVVLLVIPILLVPVIAGLAHRPWAVLAFAAILVAQKPLLVVLQGTRGPGLIPALAGTARVQLVYGLLLSIGLFVSSGALG